MSDAMTNDFRATAPAARPPRAFSFPAVERLTLSNGIRLLLAPAGDAPLTAVRVIVRDGSDQDPEGRCGLASLTSEMLDEGTATRGAIDIASEVADLGASLATGSDWDASYVALDVLARNLVAGIEIVADVVRHPAFEPGELARVRDERLTAILQNRDEPSVVAGETFARRLFDGTPYAWPLIGNEASVGAVTRDEIASFFAERYRPGNISIAIAGCFDAGNAVRTIEALLGDWQNGPAPERRDFSAQLATTSTIAIVDRPQSVQSELRVGHVGLDRSTPDYFSLAVMNGILGGVFTSRLNMNLREKNAFTYHVRSGFSLRRSRGPFVVSTAVRNDVTGAALREILAELRRIGSGDIEPAELDEVKSYLGGVFPQSVATASSLAGRLEEMEVHKLDPSWFDHYRDRLAAVTADDVVRVAREHIHPDRVSIVVVGNATEVRPQVEGLGMDVIGC
ncbi:MAG: insulinase family protein [Acidobacteria bacterium]|nr:insulinase family protein [Acidobacteriota bacterium]